MSDMPDRRTPHIACAHAGYDADIEAVQLQNFFADERAGMRRLHSDLRDRAAHQ
jgi:hypothetical protein